MNVRSLLLVLFALMMTACASAEPVASPVPVSEWVLVWQDEFDGSEIDRTKWIFDIGGHGWGNNEWQFYTDRPENARIENRMLVIEARQERFIRRNYTSARLKTQGLYAWTYGRIEARMKLPSARGLWPAFWMLGTSVEEVDWPACGEIDIMEYIGPKAPGEVYGTIHGPGYAGGGAGLSGSLTLPESTLTQDFHIYAIEWEPDEIRWYFDDQEYFRVRRQDVPGEWVFDQPFFIILNLAVGGNWPGYPDESTPFPQFLYVDYVRIYQRPEWIAQERYRGPVHVGAMTLDTAPDESGWRARVTVVVHNAEGQPVPGIKVRGGWVGIVTRGELSGVTDENGIVSLLSETTDRLGEVTFCVTSLTGPEVSYDKSANAQTCATLKRE